MVEGGRSPLLSRQRLTELGFRFIIYPVAGLATTAAVLQKTYADLATGDVEQARVSFEQLSQIVGFGDSPKD
jgi:2-methylisocitrate lyase-like PEP mutase family enzyme